MSTLDTAPQQGAGQDRSSRTAAEWLWPLLPIGVSVFCLSALVYYHLYHEVVNPRSALQLVIAGIYRTMGLAPSVLFFLLALTWSSIWFVTGRLERPVVRAFRLMAMAIMLGVFLNLGDGGVTADIHKGTLGAWLATTLVSAFGYFASIVLVWLVTFASLLLATDFFFSDGFERLRVRSATTEIGVESAVTDHLRGLVTAMAETGSGGAAAAATAAPSPLLAALSASPGADVRSVEDGRAVEEDVPLAPAAADEGTIWSSEAAIAEASDEPPSEGSEARRRMSYFERRDLETGSRSASEDSWVPMGPDSQEIDNPEIGSPEASRPAEDRVGGGSGVVDSVARDEFPSAGIPSVDREAVAETPVWAGFAEVPPAAVVGDDGAMVDGAMVDGGAEVAGPVDAAFADGVGAADAELLGALEPEPSTWGDEARPEPRKEASSRPDEPIVQIPRPEGAPRVRPAPTSDQPPKPAPREEAPAARQQGLFDSAADEALVEEAIELLTGTSRVTATLLQRRLRIDYSKALLLMAKLAARGILELEADASQGRVVV